MTLSFDDQHGIAREARQELAQILAAKRDTAFGRGEVRPRAMQKDRAASAFAARHNVIIEYDDKIVEPVIAP